MPFRPFLLAAAVGLAFTGAAQAATTTFAAHLTGAQEVPANTETGSGDLKAVLDEDAGTLTYTITYSGLTGPAIAAHFHGPAGAGENAPPTVPITELASPVKGVAQLSSGQIGDLRAGVWYFNIHTAAHKGGEIRGQVEATK